jgi:DnaJ-class molecular chaperone
MKELKAPIKYSKICDNCRGNGYVTVIDSHNKTNIHQCWKCESEGETKRYDQAEVDDFIYNVYYRKRLQ